ncbi:methylisocitrate lyase [Xylaria bambusicola]|uniref:methylisocitrate lyase n=1 Tax=Xylaria bambusicola TaxID=326684 RepID=UPI00200875DF|nr:methylisocitrate lyase [Xylaria bambusicola]KAI0517224.1 methylisocitrate lyase [Xylaria bambusicola]
MSLQEQSLSPGSRLRQLLATGKTLVCPGVYDGFSARMALAAGFECLYMTGAGVSMSRIGMADLGLATQTEMVDTAGMIANIDPKIPLIADADTGYGTATNVFRTVERYITAGVAGFHLEDQVVTKKCGHLKGKECVSLSEYLTRIKAAVDARKRRGSDIVIIARTDSLATHDLDEALRRLKAAVEVGADAVFLEAISTKDQLEAYCNAFRGSKVATLHNMVQGSPQAYKITPKEAEQYGLGIMLYPAVCLLPAYLGITSALRALKGGLVEDDSQGITPAQIFQVCGMNEIQETDKEVSEWVQRFEAESKQE